MTKILLIYEEDMATLTNSKGKCINDGINAPRQLSIDGWN